MPSCCITYCGARKNKDLPTLSLHKFPTNEPMKTKWLEILGAEHISPYNKTWFVCSLHFEEKSFNRTLDVMRLHDGALPLPLNQYLTNISGPVDSEIISDFNINQDASSSEQSPENISTPVIPENITHFIVKQNAALSLQKVQQENEILQKRCISLKKKVRSLNEQVKRRDKKLAVFDNIFKQILKNKNKVTDYSIILKDCEDF